MTAPVPSQPSPSEEAGEATTAPEGRRPVVGYVPGGFDMLHIGHLNILKAASRQCDRLIVGVATDESLHKMKDRYPVVPFEERVQIVAALRFVDEAVADTDQDKRIAWHAHPFDVIFKGDDWKGTPKGDGLEAQMAEVGARVVYMPYTKSTSSTILRAAITDGLLG